MHPPGNLVRLILVAGCLCGPIGAAAGAPPNPVTAAELEGLSKSAEQELRGNILPFWLKYARDREHGGFHSFIGEDLKPHDDLPHAALLTSRILWTFSAAYRAYRDPEYLEMARWAYRDLVDRFVDKQYGGLFWTIRPDGQPDDAHKQMYGQVFGIYGLAEYYRATGDVAALQQAVAIYGLIEKNAHDPVNGGYFDALSREWRRGDNPRGNLLGDAPKSQNSHIHILEGFTNLLRVWPDEGLRQRERELIELTMSRIIDPRTHHLVLFMKEDWTPIGDDVSYGHDIELSWLLVEAADVLGDPALVARARQEAVAIARVTNAEGWRRVQRGRPEGSHQHAQGVVGAGRGRRRLPQRLPDLGRPGVPRGLAEELALHPGEVRGPETGRLVQHAGAGRHPDPGIQAPRRHELPDRQGEHLEMPLPQRPLLHAADRADGRASRARNRRLAGVFKSTVPED